MRMRRIAGGASLFVTEAGGQGSSVGVYRSVGIRERREVARHEEGKKEENEKEEGVARDGKGFDGRAKEGRKEEEEEEEEEEEGPSSSSSTYSVELESPRVRALHTHPAAYVSSCPAAAATTALAGAEKPKERG
uniref:Uncharacterized protein n=1 Tax=Vespula pensylvanica TaxID=30213 RepID=A0A834N1H9_VESPE|nr:hypothetical protein H0235_017374 [Vespula pensylvanica]